MKHARDAAEELVEMPCVLDVVRGSSIASVRNCLQCRSNILSMRARAEVLEDRRGNAINELKESMCLE